MDHHGPFPPSKRDNTGFYNQQYNLKNEVN